MKLLHTFFNTIYKLRKSHSYYPEIDKYILIEILISLTNIELLNILYSHIFDIILSIQFLNIYIRIPLLTNE